MQTITGNTYPHRTALKSLGGRWNAAKKCWQLPDETAEEAQSLVNRKHPADDYVSYEIRTSGGTFYRNKRGRCEDAPCCGCCTF
jgi:hypothetical protein